MTTPTCRSMKEFDCGWYGVDVACGHTSVLPAALSSGALSGYMDFTPWFPTKFFSAMTASLALLAFTGATSVVLVPTSIMRKAHFSPSTPLSASRCTMKRSAQMMSPSSVMACR